MTKHLKPSSVDLGTTEFHYYDLKKNWRKVKPHLSDPMLNYLLVYDFNKFTRGRWRKPFLHGQYPAEFCCDRSPDNEDRRPRYAFMNYVAHGACHWLVNFALRLATLVEPDREWRIITSKYHSTVWDGRDKLFEFNWQAFGELPEECFHAAYDVELPLGKYMDADFVPHSAKDMRRRAAKLQRDSATAVDAEGPAV